MLCCSLGGEEPCCSLKNEGKSKWGKKMQWRIKCHGKLNSSISC